MDVIEVHNTKQLLSAIDDRGRGSRAKYRDIRPLRSHTRIEYQSRGYRLVTRFHAPTLPLALTFLLILLVVPCVYYTFSQGNTIPSMVTMAIAVVCVVLLARELEFRVFQRRRVVIMSDGGARSEVRWVAFPQRLAISVPNEELRVRVVRGLTHGTPYLTVFDTQLCEMWNRRHMHALDKCLATLPPQLTTYDAGGDGDRRLQ